MSDRIAVMNAGRIEQVGNGQAIYSHPETPFVASFVGESNAVPGQVVGIENGLAIIDTRLGRLAGRAGQGLAAGAQATLFVRPELVRLDASAGDCSFAATLGDLDFEGSVTHMGLRTAQGSDLTATMLALDPGALPQPGAALQAHFAPAGAIVLPGTVAA